MGEPIRDAEELGKIGRDAGMRHGGHEPYSEEFWQTVNPWARSNAAAIATAIRDACVPPDHVVVPRAEHDALMAAGDTVIHLFDSDGPCSASMVEAVNAFWQRLAEYRAALGTEATE